MICLLTGKQLPGVENILPVSQQLTAEKRRRGRVQLGSATLETRGGQPGTPRPQHEGAPLTHSPGVRRVVHLPGQWPADGWLAGENAGVSVFPGTVHSVGTSGFLPSASSGAQPWLPARLWTLPRAPGLGGAGTHPL